jgi:hypothetical protein
MVKRVNIILLITIISILLFDSTAAAETYEQQFQQKANLLIEHLANNYKIPNRGDREKYVWPALIAYQAEYPQAQWTPEQEKLIAQFTRRNPDSFYTNQDAFSAPGITRLLYLAREKSSINQAQNDYLNYLFAPSQSQKYSFWTSGGTENFVNMLRTSGYLLAQLGVESKFQNAQLRQQEKAEWILRKAKTTYQVGTAEWDSSTYNTFNIIGWLNLYDFAEDPEIKLAAKAVLDYYASAIALKYTYGVQAGAEQRGGSALSSFNTYSDYLAWLWFSDYIPEDASFFSWPKYIQTIYAATSDYRPPIEAVELAQKQLESIDYYQNYKANYALSNLNIPEFFYIGKTFTLGSVLAPLGEQLVNWKLVAYPTSTQNTSVVTGGNLYYRGKFNGVGKTTFDRYIQHQNILIQTSYIPKSIKRKYKQQQFSTKVKNLIDSLKCGKSCQFLLKNKLFSYIPPVAYPIAQKKDQLVTANYITYESGLETLLVNNIYFVQLPQTYLAIHPLESAELYQTKRRKWVLNTEASLGELIGFVIEVGDRYTHGSFEDFQNSVVQNSRLNLDNIEQGELVYQSSDGTKLTVNYQEITKPLDTQKASKSGSDGIKIKVDGQNIDLDNTAAALYQGKHLNIKDGVLLLQGKNSVYQVDYRSSIPQFNRSQTDKKTLF